MCLFMFFARFWVISRSNDAGFINRFAKRSDMDPKRATFVKPNRIRENDLSSSCQRRKPFEKKSIPKGYGCIFLEKMRELFFPRTGFRL